ncbi:hypothetical protein JCM8547_000373 [Rhodosporidiobolus lusitaniae]
MLQIHDKDQHAFPVDITRLSVPTVFTINISSSSPTALNGGPRTFDFEHVQINSFVASRSMLPWARPEWDMRERVLPLVKSTERLKCVSLPSQLLPTAAIPSNLAKVRDEVLSTCKERGIQVIWRLDSKEPEDDLAPSKEFWEYTKELKRLRTGEEQTTEKA